VKNHIKNHINFSAARLLSDGNSRPQRTKIGFNGKEF
jgi:hypothetical protein